MTFANGGMRRDRMFLLDRTNGEVPARAIENGRNLTGSEIRRPQAASWVFPLRCAPRNGPSFRSTIRYRLPVIEPCLPADPAPPKLSRTNRTKRRRRASVSSRVRSLRTPKRRWAARGSSRRSPATVCTTGSFPRIAGFTTSPGHRETSVPVGAIIRRLASTLAGALLEVPGGQPERVRCILVHLDARQRGPHDFAGVRRRTTLTARRQGSVRCSRTRSSIPQALRSR